MIEEVEWAQGIIRCLNIDDLPTNKEETRNFKRKVAQFIKIDDILCKRGFSTVKIDGLVDSHAVGLSANIVLEFDSFGDLCLLTIS